MKAIKYVFLSALLMGFSMVANAQTGTSADVDAVKQLVKNKPADYDKQLKAYTKANKKNAENLVAIGRALYENADYTNAVAFANAAFSAKKNFVPAFNLLGDIASVSEEDGGKAASYYEQAIYFNPKDPEAYRKYAIVYRNVSLDGAISKLEDLRQQLPDYPVDALIGHVNYVSMNYTAAMNAYRKVADGKLSNDEFFEYVISGYRCKQYGETVDVIKKGLKQWSNDIPLTRMAMYCLVEDEKYEEALNYGGKLFGELKANATIIAKDYMMYGRAFDGVKNYDEAIANYKQGLSMKSDDEKMKNEFYNYLGEAYKGKKDYPKAIEYYQSFLDNQEEPSAIDYAEMGSIYAAYASSLEGEEQMNYFKKADEWYAGMLKKYPDTSEYVTFRRARVNAAMDQINDEGRVIVFCKELIEMISSHETLSNTDKTRLDFAYRQLLKNALGTKDYPAALEYATKIHEMFPNDEGINNAIEQLTKAVK